MPASPYPAGSALESAYLLFYQMHGVGFDVNYDADVTHIPEVSSLGALRVATNVPQDAAYVEAVQDRAIPDSIESLAQWITWTKHMGRAQRVAAGVGWIDEQYFGVPTEGQQQDLEDAGRRAYEEEQSRIRRRLVDDQVAIWVSNLVSFAGHDEDEVISHLIPGWTTTWGDLTIGELEDYTGASLPGRTPSSSSGPAWNPPEPPEWREPPHPSIGGGNQPAPTDPDPVNDPRTPHFDPSAPVPVPEDDLDTEVLTMRKGWQLGAAAVLVLLVLFMLGRD